MSKVKSSDIPHYELLYLISNKYSENEVKPIVEQVKKIIEAKGGKITASEDWGKKHLAYPIKSWRFGYYNLVEFDLAGQFVAEVNRALRLSNDILRHQIVAKKVKTIAEIDEEKRIAAKIAAQGLKEEKIAEEQEKTKDKSKVDLKDLDAKLDKILETDDLL